MHSLHSLYLRTNFHSARPEGFLETPAPKLQNAICIPFLVSFVCGAPTQKHSKTVQEMVSELCRTESNFEISNDEKGLRKCLTAFLRGQKGERLRSFKGARETLTSNRQTRKNRPGTSHLAHPESWGISAHHGPTTCTRIIPFPEHNPVTFDHPSNSRAAMPAATTWRLGLRTLTPVHIEVPVTTEKLPAAGCRSAPKNQGTQHNPPPPRRLRHSRSYCS
jgi:hypothetical protein